jgi:hypothetical protein
MVVHSAPLAELALCEQDTRLNLAEILAGWKADYPDINVETFLLPGPPRTVPRCRMTCSCWSSAVPTAAGNGHAGPVPSHAPHSIGPPVRSPSFAAAPAIRDGGLGLVSPTGDGNRRSDAALDTTQTWVWASASQESRR